MLYIVKFFDTDVEENYEMEFGNLNHALETYGMYKAMKGIKNICLLSYENGKSKVIK
jgi:hypothetical protein